MRHHDVRATAPTNAEARWPAGYIEDQREAGAQEKTIPYCLGWVRRFFAAHPGRARRDLRRREAESYLGRLASGSDVTNWQVQPARDALEPYHEQFRGNVIGPRPETPTSHGMPPAGTEAASTDAEPRASSVREPPLRAVVAEAQGDYRTGLADVKAGGRAPASGQSSRVKWIGRSHAHEAVGGQRERPGAMPTRPWAVQRRPAPTPRPVEGRLPRPSALSSAARRADLGLWTGPSLRTRPKRPSGSSITRTAASNRISPTARNTT
jgi:hypothetical protein